MEAKKGSKRQIVIFPNIENEVNDKDFIYSYFKVIPDVPEMIDKMSNPVASLYYRPEWEHIRVQLSDKDKKPSTVISWLNYSNENEDDIYIEKLEDRIIIDY